MRFRMIALVCAAVLAACVEGCGPSSNPPVPPASQDALSAAGEVEAQRTAVSASTIHGVSAGLLGERVPAHVVSAPSGGIATPAAPAAATLGAAVLPTVSLTVRGFAFPETLRITPGTQVVWLNADADDHDVTAVDDTWGSPVLTVGASYSRNFMEPGRYVYFCSLHPFMRGVVIVEQP